MEGTAGGQTKDNVSGWTVDTLHSHVVSMFTAESASNKALLEERNNRYMAKFESADKAVAVAEESNRQWKASNNEWRNTMADKDRNQMTRTEISAELNALRSTLSTIRNLSLSAILVCCSVITVILLIVRPHL